QKSLSVKTGVHRLTDGRHQAVSRCHMHPHYRKRNLVNDIAVLELTVSVNYNEFQRPICLPLDAKDMVGKDGVIAGWGRESYGGRDRQTPKEANVPFVAQSECTTKYGAIILESNLCAGGDVEDACPARVGTGYAIIHNLVHPGPRPSLAATPIPRRAIACTASFSVLDQ
ncbi:hypothetical protein MTO96_045529, partial [Rhipicephalus appendiculatus]